jgi:hypothetical protein
MNQIIATVSSFLVFLLDLYEYVIIALNTFVEKHINAIPQYQVYLTSSTTGYENFNNSLQQLCLDIYEIFMIVFISTQYFVLLFIYKCLNGRNEVVITKLTKYIEIFKLEELKVHFPIKKKEN